MRVRVGDKIKVAAIEGERRPPVGKVIEVREIDRVALVRIRGLDEEIDFDAILAIVG